MVFKDSGARKVKGVGVLKDKEIKLDEIESTSSLNPPHTSIGMFIRRMPMRIHIDILKKHKKEKPTARSLPLGFIRHIMGFHHTHTRPVIPCHVANLYSIPNPNQPCFQSFCL